MYSVVATTLAAARCFRGAKGDDGLSATETKEPPVDWIIEIVIDILGYAFMSGEDREWSILRTSITLAVIVALIILAYIFLK
jgi:hypothetical protein